MAEDSSTYAEGIQAYLVEHGGGVHDAGGRGLGEEIARAVGMDKAAMVAPVLDQMERDGVITREMRGFRTYRIDLVAPGAAASPAGNGAHAAPPALPDATPALPEATPAVAPPAAIVAPVVDRATTDAPDAPPPPKPTGAISLRKALAQRAAGSEAASASEDDTATIFPEVGARRTSRFARPTTLPLAPPGAISTQASTVEPTALADTTASYGPAPSRSRLTVAIPEVKRVPTNTIVIAVVTAAVVLILIAVISVIATRGPVSHTPAAGSLASSTDACAVVPPTAAATAFGDPAGIPHLVLGTCVYDDGSHELIAAVARVNARAQFDSSRPPAAVDVPALGDAAYYANGRLWVMKGTNLLLLTLTPFSPTAPSPQLIALATSSIAHL